MAVKAEDFFEVGLIVPDLEKAVAELSAALGVTFTDVLEGLLPMRTADGEESAPPFRMVYSRQPPILEVIEQQPGTRLVAPEGTSLHHFGSWVEDLAAEVAALEAAGVPFVSGGLGPNGEFPHLWAYHQTSDGTLVELLSTKTRPSVLRVIAEGTFDAAIVKETRGAIPKHIGH
jgi:catechol 2,3-dioxygenase-like lactoylglutathione lyase family enzyme